MSKLKNGTVVFLVTMIISFLVLGIVFLAVLFFSKSKNVNENQENIPYKSEYQSTKEENLAILVLSCEEPESLPDSVTLLYYDAPQGIIYPIVLPSNTVCTTNSRTDTIQGHYDYEGTRGAVNAVNSLFSIEIDKYIRLQKVGTSNIVDFLGGIPYNLSTERTIGNETILKGEQLLDGRRVCSLLFAKNDNNICDYKLQSELITKLLESSINKKLVDKYTNFVSTIFYNCETNLNQYDFAKRQTGFISKLKLDSMVTKETIIHGQYNMDYTAFNVSKDSINTINSLINN